MHGLRPYDTRVICQRHRGRPNVAAAHGRFQSQVPPTFRQRVAKARVGFELRPHLDEPFPLHETEHLLEDRSRERNALDKVGHRQYSAGLKVLRDQLCHEIRAQPAILQLPRFRRQDGQRFQVARRPLIVDLEHCYVVFGC